jgi:hypothetical protein
MINKISIDKQRLIELEVIRDSEGNVKGFVLSHKGSNARIYLSLAEAVNLVEAVKTVMENESGGV